MAKQSDSKDFSFNKKIIDFVDEGIAIIDQDLTLKECNSWLLNRLNLSELPENQPCYTILKNRKTPCSYCPVLPTLKTGESHKELLHNPFEEREFKWYEIIAHPIKDKENNTTASIVTYRDTTALKDTEKELRRTNEEYRLLNRQLKSYTTQLSESELRYKTLYDNAPLAYLSFDEDGILSDVNPQWSKLLGYTKEEAIGSTFFNYLFEKEKDAFAEYIEQLKKETYLSDIKCTLLCKNKSLLYASFECFGKKAEESDKYQFFCTFKDITKEEKTLQELNDNKNRLEKLFKVAPTGIIMLKDDIIKEVNDEVVYMTGYTPNELIEQNVKLLFCKNEQYSEACEDLQRQIEDNGSGKIETEWYTKSGKKLSIVIVSAPLVSNNQDKGIIITALDISERKKYETSLNLKNKEYEQLNEELRMTNERLLVAKNKAIESNHLKSEFLHNMSHEIRTPMNGIIGFADMLQEPDITAQKKDFYAKIIKSSSHQLLRIIDDILEISRLETKQVKSFDEEVNLNDLLMEQFSIFSLKAKERQIPLYVKKGLTDKESTIITDKSKLNKILQNLVENALKFTSAGYVEMGYYVSEKMVHLYVKDTGVGISQENLKLIFERFSQEEKDLSQKQGGLGLGLSISKENAQILGGYISVDSSKGEGSTFTVNIPYTKPLVKPEEDKDASPEDDSFNVLIAEDEEINYLFLETVLQEIDGINMNIMHAFNGQEAVEMYKKNAIDLILMDIKMPVMDGHQATRIIRSLDEEIPIIAQTAYATEVDKIRAKDVGYNEYLTKPISHTTLLKVIDEKIKEKKQNQA